MAHDHSNPVWPGYFADPFVLRWHDVYYAYGTGEHAVTVREGAPRAFEVLRSPDLANWELVGGALIIPPGASDFAFWAPEVAEKNGQFFMYYSRAPRDRDELHRVHVALANSPTGPFNELGPVLPEQEGFCIDAHPFRDPRDGKWYLLFAKDFFNDRTGTGIAVVELAPDMRRPVTEPHTVLRPNHEWQVYERDRVLYGQRWSAWHTVEGPCVVMHDRRYYCFYSGGNWQTPNYGVSYAVADHPLGPWSHAAETGPLVLRERPPDVLGPGHNSYVVAPDGYTELLVYHAWDAKRTKRRMCLDQLVWTENGPRCLGPTLAEARR